MANVERRLARLESESGEDWSLTKYVIWLDNPTDEVPSGSLVECLSALPVARPPWSKKENDDKS
jgi:hypothetical protein